MKNYKQLIKELPSKSVVFAFGRFNPPTIGHELLVRAVRKLAQQRKADHVIYASASHDAKKNPLDVTKKVGYLRQMFPNTNFVPAGGDERTFIEAAKALNKRYKNLIMIAGSDRVPAFRKLLNDYNGKDFHFDTIEVVSAGERDPDADDATGMSASKMRALAVKGDYLQFKKGLPTTMRDIDGRRLMNDIRHGMGLDLVKEQIKLVKDDLREQYFRGEVFKLGDIVESAGEVFKIIKRGSNHLLVEDQIGNKVSKWIQDVSQTEKAFMLHEDLTDKTLKVNTDKIKVARIIATMLGIDNAESMSNPDQLVNNALRKARQKALNPEALKIVAKMLVLADEVGIKYDETLKPQKLKEDTGSGAASALTAKRQAKMADLTAKQAKEKEDLVTRQKKESEQLKSQMKVSEAVKDDGKVHTDSDYNLAKSIMSYSDYKKTVGQVKQKEVKDDNKETESDIDASVGDAAQPHTFSGHTLEPSNNHHLRRQKVRYHIGESVEFRLDHRDKVKGDHKPTFADHEAKITDTTDKATYVRVPKHKADSFKRAMKEKHGVRAELDEETQEQTDDRVKQLKRFKDQAKNTKLVEVSEEYCADEYGSGEVEINTGEIDDSTSDTDLDKLLDQLSDNDYIEHAYDDDELALIDAETGEDLSEDSSIDEQALMEVLSRMERIKARTRMRTTKAKRVRQEKIALKRYSDSKTINKRARRMAIKLMKQRMLRGRNLSNISVQEKERLEKTIQKRSAVVGRIATKLAPRIRKLEKNRLSHSKFTVGSSQNVF